MFYAAELFNFPDYNNRQQELLLVHSTPFPDIGMFWSLTRIDQSLSYLCPNCGKVWAYRSVAKEIGPEAFEVRDERCMKCGPRPELGYKGGAGRLFREPMELELYLPRLPLILKINEFMS